MNRYWMYLNNEVAGPFEVDRLIRQRGFAREARVCLEQADGGTGDWMSASEIPELAKIFRAADQMNAPDPAPVVPKHASKPPPVVHMPKPPPPSKPKPEKSFPWVWTLLGLLAVVFCAVALLHFLSRAQYGRQNEMARQMVENANFPSDSPYRTVRHYLDDKKIRPRWDVERVTDGLSKVTLSWFDEKAATRSHVYAFETNEQALTVRALNTAAERWLNEGPVPRVKAPLPQPPAPKKPSSDELFKSAVETRRVAIENADYAAVWNLFTRRKQSEMIQAGMSETGFVQLQMLRNKVDNAPQQQILKTSKVSVNERLLLMKEIHASHGNTFLKQRWMFEDGEWHLDDEEKRSAPESNAPSDTSSAPAQAAPKESPSPVDLPANENKTKPTIPVQSLPGIN